MAVPLYEVAAGVILIFVLPGFAVTKAVFPELRVRGADAVRSAVVLATSSLVLSVALTVVVGFGLLHLAPSGFQAAWTDPVLEGTLFAISVVAFVVGWFRGAYRRVPISRPTSETPWGGEEGAWELQRRLDLLQLKERRLLHRLKGTTPGTPEEGQLQREIEIVRTQNRELRETRQGEYAR